MGSRLKKKRDPRHPRSGGPARRSEEWLYGRRPVREALRSGRRRVFELLVAAGPAGGHREAEAPEDVRDLALRAGATVRHVKRFELDERLGDYNHQGMALRCGPYPYADMGEVLRAVEADPRSLVLLLDHIEDPQNVGSLLRTADAVGIAGVILPEDRAAGVTPAAVRASAGATEHLRVVRVVNLTRAMQQLKACGCWLTGLALTPDARPYQEVDLRDRCGIVIGNEGRGLGRLVTENCDFLAKLPMLGQVGSLNAGVAGALMLYEVLRQRGG